MTICYTGDYNPTYPRHRVLIRGLRENGVTVIERPLPRKGYFELFKALRTKADLFFFGYSDSRFIWLARLLTTKPIVWDAFYSIYDNWVFDRKLVPPGSWKARYYWLLDWLCCTATRVIILDTNANIDYFRRTFSLHKKRFVRVLVGTDDTVMIPQVKNPAEQRFIVEFHGRYIPVQGVEYIIHAANLLRSELDIQFVLVGEGQEYEKIRALAEKLMLTNVTFQPNVPYEDLPKWIANADVCLGLMGNYDRGARAIPNKIYEASAMEHASITMDGPGIRELYTDGENILLCRGGDPRDIADKILELKNNPELRNQIAHAARQLYLRHAIPKAIGKKLKEALQ